MSAQAPASSSAGNANTAPYAHLHPNSGRAAFHQAAATSLPPVSSAPTAEQTAASRLQAHLLQGRISLARYLLQCEAIGEPIDDENDLRRLITMTDSMARVNAEQFYGHGNKISHNAITKNESLYLMLAGKRLEEKMEIPSHADDPEGHFRTRTTLAATMAAWLQTSSCGGCSALLTYRYLENGLQQNTMAPGEVVVNAHLIELSHEYCELRPSSAEQELAAAEGKIKHAIVGDTWLDGGAAMLRPHTRHAACEPWDIFAIPQERAAIETDFFHQALGTVPQEGRPYIERDLVDIRAHAPAVKPHPFEGKSVASPDFVRKACEALDAMDPDTRREKAIAALRKAGVDHASATSELDRFIEAAMTILPSETG